MEQVSESVIRKIQQLLMVSKDKSVTEGEASNAMDLAQKLLTKHNLDMAIVQDTVVEGGTKKAPANRKRQTINRSAMYKYQEELWEAIARTNFCVHFVTKVQESGKKRPVKRHAVIGAEVNVIATEIMGVYLSEAIERLQPFPHVQRLSKSAISWKTGCTDRLRVRLYNRFFEQQNNTADSSKDSMALAIRDHTGSELSKNWDMIMGEEGWYSRWLASQGKQTDEQIAAEKKRHEQKHREATARAARMDPSAYRAGSKAGDSISLNSQLNTATTKAIG